MNSLRFSLLFTLSLTLQAAAQHADILVSVGQGQLQIAALDGVTGVATPASVFAADLGETGIPHYIDEPGVLAHAGALPVGSTIGFEVFGPLLQWDGASFVETDAGGCVDGETMTIQFASLLRETACADVSGFALSVQADGGFHKHYVFGVQPDVAGVIQNAVYALQLVLRSNDPVVADSAPLWIVFNDGMSEIEHDAAIAFLEGPACAGDLDNSGAVDGLDFSAVLSAWGSASATADINGDGLVDGQDLLVLLAAWGPCV